jgi:sulfur carrier protein
MDMVVNGNRVSIEVARVSELLLTLGFQGKRVAVERNGQIVPRSEYDKTMIAPQDRIEIVIAVGGG